MKITRKQRAGAVVTTVLAALALALVGPTAAHAETVDDSMQGRASLTIHKRDATPGAAGDGTLNPNPPGEGVNGVGFTLSRVYFDDGSGPEAIDLGTNEGQALAAQAFGEWDDLTGSFPSTSPFSVQQVTVSLPTQNPGTTSTVGGEAGVLNFPRLPFGLYLVEETGPVPGVSPVDPFLVTVPFSDGTSWSYDVHVYPKNVVPDVSTKTVDDADVVQAGDVTTWSITVPLEGSYSSFVVTDQLDDLLSYAGGETVTVAGDQLGSIDYTFTEVDGLLSWTFEGSGIQALNEAAGNVLVITFQTTANGNGIIQNTANVNGVDTTPPDGPDGEGSTQKFGGITVVKTDAATDAPLDGAVFEVWVDSDHDGELTDADTRIENPDPDATDGNWTTEGGEVVVDGLRFSGFANGADVTSSDPEYNLYFLKEVAAPDGYSLLAQPIEFTVDQIDPALKLQSVENMKINAGFELPLTGGAGIAFFTTLGVLLIGSGAAIYLLVVARRRRDEAAAAARRGAIAG